MKQIVRTDNAPKPIGPYSQAVFCNNTLYISGQIAIHPETGKLITENIKLETNQVMLNLRGILHAANLDFENVIKSTIFITNMDDFGLINEVYGTYFNNKFAPARETVQVSKLPKDVHVEISLIAMK